MEAFAHAVAGSAGGTIAMAMLYPLENVRTRLQVQIEKKKKLEAKIEQINNQSVPETETKTTIELNDENKDSPGIVFPSNTPKTNQLNNSPQPSPSNAVLYKGTIDCIRKVIAREGWRALYTGLKSALIGVAYSSAAYFYWYRLLRTIALRRSMSSNLSAAENLIIASLAGIINVFMTMPIWVIQTRQTLAARADKPLSMTETANQIIEKEGFSGLYKGLVPSLILVSNPAIQFFVYEQLVDRLSAYYQKKHVAAQVMLDAVDTIANNVIQKQTLPHKVGLPKLTPVDFFVLGAIAKAVATAATYPYQVIKARLQADHRPASPWEFMSCVQQIYEEEGLGVFWRGMNAKMTQTVLNAAFMFAAYESLVRIIMALLRKAQRLKSIQP